MAPEHRDNSEATTDAPRKYTEDPHAACLTAAYKINVVIRMLRSQEDLDGLDDGGYGLTIAQDLLAQIRNDLQASVTHAEAERATQQQGGTAR